VIRTFVDADVLIYAARGIGGPSAKALQILSDPNREFVASDLLRLEVLPKAHFHNRSLETSFYETYFDAVIAWAACGDRLVSSALELAQKYGLGAMDALHLTAAEIVGAKEFVTAEKPTSPIFRVSSIQTRSIFSS
jgi:predicted nucleic acid-binding protein